MKKALCLFLSLLCVLPLLASCAKGKEKVYIIKDGAPIYGIVYRDGAATNVRKRATVLEDWFNDKCESGVAKLTAVAEDGASEEAEILIGETGRPETEEVKKTLPEVGYAVRAVGNKIVIVGTSDALTIEAAEAFTKNCLADEKFEKGDLAVDADLDITVPITLDGNLYSYIRSGKSFSVSLELVCQSPALGIYYCAQGAASDGTYVWFVLRKKASEEDYCIITKHLLSTGEKVMESEPIYLLHGNDMTYNSKKDILVVSHCSSPEADIATTIDPKTLTVVEQTVKLPCSFAAIAYNAEKNIYAASTGNKHMYFLDEDFNLLGDVATRWATGYTSQGMGGDDVYLYQPVSGDEDNLLIVTTWGGINIGEVRLPIKTESETMFYVNGEYYVSFYKKKNGAELYKLSFKYDE